MNVASFKGFACDGMPARLMKTIFATIGILLACSPSLFPDRVTENPEVMRLLSEGNQKAAEARLEEAVRRDPKNPGNAFFYALCARSRFDRRDAALGFLVTMISRPDSPEGRASACVLGIDASSDQATALYYFNALLIVGRQNPDSIPIRWLAAIMSRTLTRDSNLKLSSEVRKRILRCGIQEYEAVLTLMAPGPGPALIHQTMANLLDDVEGYDAAWKHREIIVKMERRPWSLHAAAWTLLNLDRGTESLAFVQEAIAGESDAPDYYRVQGNALWNLGRRREALSAWDRASTFQSENRWYYLKLCALGFQSLGDCASARDYTRKALAENPENRELQILDARFAAILGEPGAGERVMQAGSFDFRGNPIKAEQKSSSPWFLAVDTGDLAKFRQMLGTADVNSRTEKILQTALMVAAQSGWEQIAAELIRAGASLDLVDQNGDTALHYAADFKQPRMMKLLLDAGANPNIQDKWKQTPLIMCASDHDWDGFSLLMDKKADFNLATPHGGTALHYAAGHGDLAMVKALVASGADVNRPGEKNGATPLMVACRDWAHSYIVGPLLAGGADVNARDKDGRTALHHAVDPLLNIPLVELLLEKGANAALADNNGVTPIAQARLLGFEEIALQMERKTGRTEPFRFPKFEVAGPSLSGDEQNASLFVLPILLAQGHPLGRPSGFPKGEKRLAKKELAWMFGIENTAQLKTEIQALEEFEPRYRDDAGDLSPEIPFEKLNGMLTTAARKIHVSCSKGAADESAWVQSHIIYLADLGIGAGLLDPAEGGKLIASASAGLKAKFPSWKEFMKSFLLGAQLHNGWEADRYTHICDRIVEAGIPWP